MEPILCPTCGETVSDKYELFKEMYKNPFNTSFEEVCKELNIESICTKIVFFTTMSIEETQNIQNIKKIYQAS